MSMIVFDEKNLRDAVLMRDGELPVKLTDDQTLHLGYIISPEQPEVLDQPRVNTNDKNIEDIPPTALIHHMQEQDYQSYHRGRFKTRTMALSAIDAWLNTVCMFVAGESSTDKTPAWVMQELNKRGLTLKMELRTPDKKEAYYFASILRLGLSTPVISISVLYAEDR